MDILVPDNWLREYLKTKATKDDIQKYLSLCGPSVERILNTTTYPTYAIEVTTNRVDSASVYGIAREASAILPRFGIPAKLEKLNTKAKQKLVKKVNYLDVKVDSKLCPRFAAILIKDVKVTDSPKVIKERLTAVGVRPINNVVDISNCILHELGQPLHTFDYDKITNHKMILRESKKGEKITTLDSQKYTLAGGEIVIEDGSGELIDLVGIMGGKNSMVDSQTKNVLVFVQTYEPKHIRQTSMSLAKRSEAASLFEKGLDPEQVETATRRSIDLFIELTKGTPENQILDIYPAPYKTKVIEVSREFIENRLGIKLSKQEITNTLSPLGFGVNWSGEKIKVLVPSYRAKDVNIPEDIVEEVARIYGYQNIPSKIMAGELPEVHLDTPFRFETKIRNILKGVGGIEIYTLSLVEKSQAGEEALKLKNPLGKESEYLRTKLRPSLEKAAKDNKHIDEPFFLYELANVYLPKKSDLPNEVMRLGIIFSKYSYRLAKGVLEALLDELKVNYTLVVKDMPNYKTGHRLALTVKTEIGEFGVLDSGYIYCQFDLEKLKSVSSDVKAFNPIPKYPAQVEDLTLTLSKGAKVGEIIAEIKNMKDIAIVELKDIYQDQYTFRIHFQSPTKTLTNQEVEKLRNNIITKVNKQFGATIKA